MDWNQSRLMLFLLTNFVFQVIVRNRCNLCRKSSANNTKPIMSLRRFGASGGLSNLWKLILMLSNVHAQCIKLCTHSARTAHA